jgi:hypothetical protein
MTKDEAIEWLTGVRDMGNLTMQQPLDTYNVRVEQANAAKMEQAYWVLRAIKEELI